PAAWNPPASHRRDVEARHSAKRDRPGDHLPRRRDREEDGLTRRRGDASFAHVHQERLREPALRRRSNRPRPPGQGTVLLPGSMEVIDVGSNDLPTGLRICERCRTVRGATPDFPPRWAPAADDGLLSSTCLCDGLICRECGERRRRRPITNYYDPEKG